MTDVHRKDLRLSVEFVMKVSPYTRDDIYKLDILEFFQILIECEKQQREELMRMEKQTQND